MLIATPEMPIVIIRTVPAVYLKYVVSVNRVTTRSQLEEDEGLNQPT